MKTVIVALPEPLAAWLSRRARALGVTQSDVIREALVQAKAKATRGSCHKALADLCGSIKGARDLSTNPRHRAGFGE